MGWLLIGGYGCLPLMTAWALHPCPSRYAAIFYSWRGPPNTHHCLFTHCLLYCIFPNCRFHPLPHAAGGALAPTLETASRVIWSPPPLRSSPSFVIVSTLPTPAATCCSPSPPPGPTHHLNHITYHIFCINWLTCWSPVGTLSRPEEDGFPP